MNSLRIFCIASAAILAASFGFADDLNGKKPSKPSSPPSQGGGSRGDDRKPSSPPPSQREPKQPSSPPPSQKEPPRPPPSQKEPPRPPSSPPPGRVEPRPTPPPSQREPRNPPPREEKPKGGEEIFKPRPGSGGGSVTPLPPPREEKKGNDDLLKPRPGGGSQGSGSTGGSLPDRKPRDPRETNPRIFDPPQRGNDQTGRIDQKRDGDSLIRKKGNNVYGGTISNSNKGERSVKPAEIQRAPIDIFRGGLEHQVRREDNVRVVNRGYRSGYYHYRRDWCDDNFYFGFYVFDPFAYSNCWVSPWYYYPHLPGYLSYRCVRVFNISLNPWYGTYYSWRRPSYNYGYNDSYGYSPLDYAIDDISRAFERRDARALRRLIYDRVAIFVDGEYSYSMEADDFETFMLDNIENTRTINYEITRVERRGREAEVQARHEYEDPWGRRTSVYHYFRLEEYRGSYTITRFGTSYYRGY